jgi:integrase
MAKNNRKTNRAPQGAGGICKRSDGRWQGTYTVGTNPGTGKPVKKYVYAPTEKECVKKLKALQAEIDNGTFQQPNRISIGQWLDVWAAEYLGGVKPGTVKTYKVQIKTHITPALGAVKLQKLTPHAIQAFYNSLQRDKGLSPKTIKNIHGVLHSALEQASDLDYIRFNPADKCKLPRIEKKEVAVLTEEKIPAFIQQAGQDVYGTLMYVTLFTGLRESEVLGLTWDCVDFESGSIRIKQQLQRNAEADIYQLAPLKNDKPRLITPAPAVMQRLWAERVRQNANTQKAGEEWQNPLNLVFTNEFGKNLIQRTVVKKFKDVAAAIGEPTLRFHDLRHTYAVNALQSGDDVKTVQDTLGHHTAAFTLDTYGHATARMKQASAERMERFIQANSI